MLEEETDAFLFGERGKVAPAGVVGGKNGALNIFTYPNGGGEANPPMVSKMVGIHLTEGQRIRLETPGGGGYGDVNERDPASVAEDVRLGYVSPTAARKDYSCVVDTHGVLDSAATQSLRKHS